MGKQSREKQLRRLGQTPDSLARETAPEYVTGLEKTCLFIIRWGTYLTLFVPLIIGVQFFFPFVAPKTTLFRILVEIILAAYLILLIHKSAYRPKINLMTVVLTVFLAVFALTSFTGVNFERSFWSTYERMTGLFTMFHLYAFFIILSNCFKKRRDWEKLMGFSVLAGVFLSIYILNGNELSTRGGGTIGNTSFMAAYLLFDVFFAVILLLSNFLKKNNAAVFWQIFSGISLLVMIPVLLTSSARMAITVFWGGLFLFGLGYLAFSQKKNLKRLALGIVLSMVVLAIVLAIFQPSFVTQEIRGTYNDMKPRFAVWEVGWKGFLEKPILGWGPENFNVIFTSHFNPCMFSSCGGEIWFDRSHNIVLDTLSTMGLAGFLSYLLIFGAVIYGLIRVSLKTSEPRNVFLPLGVIIILITYFFQNLLVFDMINTYLMFFSSLAFAAFLISGEQSAESQIKKVNKLLASSILVLIVLVFWFGNVKTIAAANYLVRSISTQNIDEGTTLFKKSLDSWMNKYEAREQFSQRMMQFLYSGAGSNSATANENFQFVAEQMEKSVKENPLDFRPRLFWGKLYSAYYQFSGNAEALVVAENILRDAIKLSPTNQQGYWYLGEVVLGQGRKDEALSLMKKAVELEPKYAQSHWYLAMTYKFLGQYAEALKEASLTQDLGFYWIGSVENVKNIAEIYSALKDDRGLVDLYLKALEPNPNSVDILSSLAASYANLGQFNKARETANRIKELDPSLKDKVDEFLNSLSS